MRDATGSLRSGEPHPPRTLLPNARRSPRYGGIATFCRVPRIEDVPPEHAPVDWAIYGVPFDSGVTFRPGARFGPRAVRDASQYMKPYNLHHGVDIAQRLSMADAGDSPVKPFSCEENARTVAEFARSIGDPARTKLLAIGGDHSIAYANIRATWERRGQPAAGLALIHFDAHLDTVEVTHGERWSHASPFIRAIEDGLIDPRRMISIGIRGPLNSGADLDYARANGVEIITCDEARAPAGKTRIGAFAGRLAGAEAYLTFDIDCVDPAFAPGTGTPCCGGFTSAEALSLIRGFVGANIVGADVVEVLPDRDVSQITALLASHVMIEILALDAVAR
ncbi:MAG: agmatinase [Phycisphaeraceae bacterium]|nr:agmatinase [Phycisphaerales bacterium]QOJ16763.1 MAG: agmatinase [Phycisphaeraceae bacterium]